jgi:acetyl esterase/lipase
MTGYETKTRFDILYAVHEGVELLGDLYRPAGMHSAPVLVAAHGGAFQLGDRKLYQHWGPYLAQQGYAVFSIEYRLVKPGVKTWPGAVCDMKAAVQFVRANAGELGLDPDRVGLIGDSAGAYLAAMVALAGEEPLFADYDRQASQAAVSCKVKTVLGFYGIYDMLAQWEHDQITRPRDQLTEKFLGVPPMFSRKIFFEASPLSYVTVDRNNTKFLLIYGHEDDIVDPRSQSEKFLLALKQAGFFARTIVVPGAGHFWASEPLDEPGSFGPYVGPRLLRFLKASL